MMEMQHRYASFEDEERESLMENGAAKPSHKQRRANTAPGKDITNNVNNVNNSNSNNNSNGGTHSSPGDKNMSNNNNNNNNNVSCSKGDDDDDKLKKNSEKPGLLSRTGLAVLVLLAVQNCSKNLLMRYVMKDRPKFLTSAAVLGSECFKLILSVIYILLIQRNSLSSILYYLKQDGRNTLLLAVPASAYNFQMKLEYVALAHLNAAMFSVLVQTKLLFTATMAFIFLRKRLRCVQIISLILLTTGVMLCNLSNMGSKSKAKISLNGEGDDGEANTFLGILATLGIAVSSGFASVYTEKVIKGGGSTPKPQPETAPLITHSTSFSPARPSPQNSPDAHDSSEGSANTAMVPFHRDDYGLAYTQVQLALMSLVTIGVYAAWQDMTVIVQHGLFYNFTPSAFVSIFNSAIGGLIVAAVLKYADSVLKGYATAMSVILTGILSMLLFGTQLSVIYFMGIFNVVIAVLLYNGQGKDLDAFICG